MLTSFKAAGYHAMLNRGCYPPQTSDPTPKGIHWMLARNATPQSRIDRDGHSRDGQFLPPISLPRRMWAGSRIEFIQPMKIGETITRLSRIDCVFLKQGRSGHLVFVKTLIAHGGPSGPYLKEMQTLVYRDAPRTEDPGSEPEKAPESSEWQRTLIPDPVLLFRFSALIFNGHRIHYDRKYCVEEEGYPGLVIHGPLQANLLLDLCRRERPDSALSRFEFRAKSPLFDGEAIQICETPGNGSGKLWISRARGQLAMEAEAKWEPGM